MLESYIIARDRFLKPGGKMFPTLGRYASPPRSSLSPLFATFCHFCHFYHFCHFCHLPRIHMAPFSDEYLYVEVANKALFWQQASYYGVNLTPLHQEATQAYFSQPVVDAFDPRLLVAPSVTHTIDFSSATVRGAIRIYVSFVSCLRFFDNVFFFFFFF